MLDVGRVCVKIAGRDAGKQCVIIDILSDKEVLIDGETRRRKCNVTHLEPLTKTLEVSKKASHDVVIEAFKKLSVIIEPKKIKVEKTTVPAKK